MVVGGRRGKMRSLACVLALLAALELRPNNAEAGPLEDARAVSDHGDYQTAFRLWAALAEQGDAEAQNALGLMYATGKGVASVDGNEALKWFRRSADLGNAAAAVNLGRLYFDGTVLPRDYAAAAEWFRKAAEHGNAAGERLLGNLY